MSSTPSVNAVVLSSAVENETVRLDAKATQKLLEALDNPPAPNAKLAALFARHANRNASS